VRGLEILKLQLFVLHNTATIILLEEEKEGGKKRKRFSGSVGLILAKSSLASAMRISIPRITIKLFFGY
jgi:hypothetical protein